METIETQAPTTKTEAQAPTGVQAPSSLAPKSGTPRWYQEKIRRRDDVIEAVRTALGEEGKGVDAELLALKVAGLVSTAKRDAAGVYAANGYLMEIGELMGLGPASSLTPTVVERVQAFVRSSLTTASERNEASATLSEALKAAQACSTVSPGDWKPRELPGLVRDLVLEVEGRGRDLIHSAANMAAVEKLIATEGEPLEVRSNATWAEFVEAGINRRVALAASEEARRSRHVLFAWVPIITVVATLGGVLLGLRCAPSELATATDPATATTEIRGTRR